MPQTTTDLDTLEAERDEIASRLDQLRRLRAEGDVEEWETRYGQEGGEWEKLNTEYDAHTRSISIEMRAEAVQQVVNPEREADVLDRRRFLEESPRAGVRRHARDEALESPRDRYPMSQAIQFWALRGDAGKLVGPETRRAAHECRQACRAWNIDPHAHEIELTLPELTWRDRMRRDSKWRERVSKADDGAHLVPEDVVTAIEIALDNHIGVRPVATVRRTSTGTKITWPTVDDTSIKGRLISEAGTTNTVDITPSSIELEAYQYTSDDVYVSFQMLRDSAANLGPVIGRLLGERIARITNEHFTTGTGTAQPNGIVTATVGDAISVAAGMAFEHAIDLIYAVPRPYRNNFTFMCNDTIIATLRKLRSAAFQTGDSEGAFLWEPSNQRGEPDRLNGYPFQVNDDMDATTDAGSESLIGGDLSKYIIREVRTIRLRRLDELAAKTDQIIFLAFWEGDGELLDAGTGPVKVLQHS